MDGNIRLIRSWDPISRRWDAVRRLVCVVRRRRQCPRIKVFSPLGGSGRRTSSGKAPVAAGRLSADPSDGSGLAAACINHISLMSASRPLAGRTRAAGAAMDGPVPAIAGTLSSIIQAIAFRRIRHCWSPDKKETMDRSFSSSLVRFRLSSSPDVNHRPTARPDRHANVPAGHVNRPLEAAYCRPPQLLRPTSAATIFRSTRMSGVWDR